MWRSVLAVLALCAVAPPPAGGGDPPGGKVAGPDAVRKALYRCWLEVESVEAGTQIAGPDGLCGHQFAPDIWYCWDRRGELAIGPGRNGPRIDPSATPMRVELRGGTPGRPVVGAPAVRPGIFKFDGDKLILALGPWTEERAWGKGEDYPKRPKEFMSTKDNGVTLLTHKPCDLYDQD